MASERANTEEEEEEETKRRGKVGVEGLLKPGRLPSTLAHPKSSRQPAFISADGRSAPAAPVFYGRTVAWARHEHLQRSAAAAARK